MNSSNVQVDELWDADEEDLNTVENKPKVKESKSNLKRNGKKVKFGPSSKPSFQKGNSNNTMKQMEEYQKQNNKQLTSILETNINNLKKEYNALSQRTASQMQTLYNFVLVVWIITFLTIILLISLIYMYRKEILIYLNASMKALNEDDVVSAVDTVAAGVKHTVNKVQETVQVPAVPSVMD